MDIYELPENYPDPQKEIEWVNEVIASDDQEIVDKFMWYYFQRHTFTYFRAKSLQLASK